MRIFRFVIRGVVQGVGFRWFVLHHARAIGVTGFTRNLPSGEVEVVASGPIEQLARLEEALRRGPNLSRVEAVDKSEILDEIERYKSFDIK